MADISIGVLGPLRVVDSVGPHHLRPAQRRLLSILLLQPEEQIDREVLLDRMWNEDPPTTGITALHVHVSGIRRALPGLIRTTQAGYGLDMSGVHFDRAEFDRHAERAFRAAREANWQAARRNVRRALDWWRGSPFVELQYEAYAAPDLNRLTECRLTLLELEARALLELGRIDEAAALLRALVSEQPLREPLWEMLMLALVRAGRRAEALRAFQELRRILAEELDVEPSPALRELDERILWGDPDLPEPSGIQTAHNLPAATTTFVGREDDLRRLAELLRSRRLVTIVGGPGFGKTRLAIETGQAVTQDYPAGVWFASLAEARNPLELVSAVVAAAGLREHGRSVDDVANRLAHRPALLILDNCEHQLGACADFVARVLSAGDELSLLLTSRAALGVEAEQVWRVDPLPPPRREKQAGVPGTVAASPAVRLFIDRARAVDRTFRLTPETIAAVAELCRRAEGIPLALELAARWVASLGLHEIAEMLAAEPPGSQPRAVDHHRSLTAAIEWSLALLPAEDRRVFIRAAVFNGRFGLDDIRAVCAPERERRRLARVVAGLVDASLIAVDRQPDGSALYRTLVPIREYARERLASSPEWEPTRRRFFNHYLGKRFRDEGDTLRQVIDLEPVDRDLDNLREAFHIGLALGRPDDVVSMLAQLDGYMLNRYLVGERCYWIERALEQETERATRAHALRLLASGAQVLSDLDRSLEYFNEALPLFREFDDKYALAQCLLSLSGLQSMRGEWSDGLTSAREARELASELQSVSGLAVAAYYVGENLAYAGDLNPGLAALEEAAGLFEKSAELGRASYSLSTFTSLAVLDGREESARRSAARALSLAEESKSVYRRVRALGSAALLEARYGDPQAASRMLIEAHGLMEPYELDDVFLFLLPSAFLLRQWGRWELVIDVLGAAESAMAATGVGYPQPWLRAASLLQADAREALGARAESVGRPAIAKSLEHVSAEVLSELARSASTDATRS